MSQRSAGYDKILGPAPLCEPSLSYAGTRAPARLHVEARKRATLPPVARGRPPLQSEANHAPFRWVPTGHHAYAPPASAGSAVPAVRARGTRLQPPTPSAATP